MAHATWIALFIAAPLFAGPAMVHEIEPNDTPAQAVVNVGNSAVIEGNISPIADVDFYKFTATAGDRIFVATITSFSSFSGATPDSLLTILASDGTTVIERDDEDGSFSGSSSSIGGAVIPSDGVYYLKVNHFFGSGVMLPYRLVFQKQTGAPVPETEPNDASPNALPVSGFVSGNLSSTTDVDFFSVVANAGDTIFASVDPDPERDTVTWDANGAIGFFDGFSLLVNGAGAGGAEAHFMTVKDAGTYSIRVATLETVPALRTYHLSVTVFPAASEGINCAVYGSATSVGIPAGGGTVTSTITVPDSHVIGDLDVTINGSHQSMPDLDVTLTSPEGNIVALFLDAGTAGALRTIDMTLDDDAAFPVGTFFIFSGSYQPRASSRLEWFNGEQAQGTWTLSITDDTANASGGTLTGWSLRICEPQPMPQCNAGSTPVTVFTSDFESDTGGFTHSGTSDRWERGLPSAAPITTCFSGVNCWKTNLTGTYLASSSQDLLSPNIDLAGLVPPVVVNWTQRYQMESAGFDHFFVEARQVGAPSNAVRLFEHLGPTMTATVGASTVQESSGWSMMNRSADSLAGQKIELRFHVDSDSVVNLAGAAIDDVSVTACMVLPLDAPAGLIAAAQSTTEVMLTWDAVVNADAYDVERRSDDNPNWSAWAIGVANTTFNDTTLVSDDHAYVYRVRATSATFPSSAFSKPDAASTFTFDDDPIAALIPVRATHVNRLRDAVDALRIAVGLASFAWSDDPVDNTVLVKGAHIDDLRSAGNEARTHIGIDGFVFTTDPTITPQSTLFKAAHIGELRTAVR